MKKSLIFLENKNFKNAIDLLDVVDQLYGRGNSETYAVCLEAVDKAINGKFDYLVSIVDERIRSYDAMAIVDALEELQKAYAFDCILIPATSLGRTLAPRLAMRLHVGLVADVTAIDHFNGDIEMIRPTFGGKIMAGIINQGRLPVMMSIRQNVFTWDAPIEKNTKKIDFEPVCIRPGKLRLLDVREKAKTYDIRESEVLISGGGGTLKHFHHLELLAEELKAQVSASRRIVDQGIAPRQIQVGQSGKTVSPRLYIALGIYGSMQHIEGLKNIEHIISVNTNKDAPICSMSDLVVEGDAKVFIEMLIEEIRKHR